MIDSLCDLEIKLLDYLEVYLDRQHLTPSYEEIRRALRLSSKDHVSRLLDNLEEQDFIERKRGRSRSISLLRTSDGRPFHLARTVRIPLVGLAPASFGQDTLDGFDPETYIELTQDLVPDETGIYALRVSGDSMIDAHINDGDVVVLRQQEEARNGDLVQVWLHSEENATLKRYYRQGNLICLRPENPALQPRYYPEDEVRVQGKVVLVLRSLERKLAA